MSSQDNVASSLGIAPVNLAFVGVGRYGTMLAQDIQPSPLVTIGGCYDIRGDAVEKFVKRFLTEPSSSLEEVLDRPDIDGVVIATPNVDHRRSALLALSAGKHVFVEKPLTTITSEAAELIQLAQQSQKVLMVGHNSRRSHQVRKLYQLIHTGTLGTILSVEGNFSTPSALRIDPAHWAYHRESMPGGALLDGGIHLIDICNYLLERPIAVTAVLRRRVTPGESEDSCAMLCRYLAPGSTQEGYFTDIPVSLTATTTAPTTNYLRVCGTKANACMHDRQAELLIETADGHSQPALIETPFDSLHGLSTRRQELDEFAYCIRTNSTPETDGICGMRAMAMVEAAIIANAKSGEVLIDDLGLGF